MRHCALGAATFHHDCVRMNIFWHQKPHPTLPSDQGFLAIAGDQELSVREQVMSFRQLVSSDMDWTTIRRRRFQAKAARVKVTTLILTAASTVVLGISGIPARAAIALPMVALVSVLTALDTYFNWRSRWILMEETQYKLQRLRDKIDYYLVTTPAAEVAKTALDEFFSEQEVIWAEASKRWVEYRKAESSTGGGSGGEPT